MSTEKKDSERGIEFYYEREERASVSFMDMMGSNDARRERHLVLAHYSILHTSFILSRQIYHLFYRDLFL